MKRSHEYEGVVEDEGRADVVLSKALSIPRSVFSLRSALVLINGVPKDKATKVKKGDRFRLSYDEEVFEGVKGEEIDLKVIYEDNDILVIDKPQGLVVHPGAGVHSGTLVNALVGRFGEDFMRLGDETRPGIVHRLDKDTSGIMIVAKSEKAMRRLSDDFKGKEVEKHYVAILRGEFLNRSGEVSRRIVRDSHNRKKFTTTDDTSKGKDATTLYEIIDQKNGYALALLRLITGRTHQIRVHMQSLSHPVLGDPVYSYKDSRFPLMTLMLHSYSLRLHHPITREEMTFISPLPERFLGIIIELGLERGKLL